MPRESCLARCPFCNTQIYTEVVKVNGDYAAWAGLLFCLALGLLCFWIPYVISHFKDSIHYCP